MNPVLAFILTYFSTKLLDVFFNFKNVNLQMKICFCKCIAYYSKITHTKYSYHGIAQRVEKAIKDFDFYNDNITLYVLFCRMLSADLTTLQFTNLCSYFNSLLCQFTELREFVYLQKQFIKEMEPYLKIHEIAVPYVHKRFEKSIKENLSAQTSVAENTPNLICQKNVQEKIIPLSPDNTYEGTCSLKGWFEGKYKKNTVFFKVNKPGLYSISNNINKPHDPHFYAICKNNLTVHNVAVIDDFSNTNVTVVETDIEEGYIIIVDGLLSVKE